MDQGIVTNRRLHSPDVGLMGDLPRNADGRAAQEKEAGERDDERGHTGANHQKTDAGAIGERKRQGDQKG